MSLEIIAIQWVIDGWGCRNFLLILFGITLLVFDVVSDCFGFPT